jgi:peptidoglycan/LPS O-acetylase OafA/YrhL
LLRYLTLTQIYTDNFLVTYLHPGLSQMWSLAVEVSFYAVLPVLAVLLLRRSAKGRPAVTLTRLAALAAVTPVWLIVVNTTDLLPNSAGMWLPGHLTSFTGGMALAVLSVVGTRWNACATLPLAAALYFAVATPIGGVIVGTVPAWVPVTKECLYAAIAMLVVGTVVLGSPNRYTRILSSPPVVWLGEISYEIFLLHTVVMAVVMNLVLRWPLFTGSLPGLYVTTLAVTIPLAVLLHRFTRIDRRLRPAPAARALARPAPVRDATPRPSPPASIQPQFASSLRG